MVPSSRKLLPLLRSGTHGLYLTRAGSARGVTGCRPAGVTRAAAGHRAVTNGFMSNVGELRVPPSGPTSTCSHAPAASSGALSSAVDTVAYSPTKSVGHCHLQLTLSRTAGRSQCGSLSSAVDTVTCSREKSVGDCHM